jgi:hypothetical protein
VALYTVMIHDRPVAMVWLHSRDDLNLLLDDATANPHLHTRKHHGNPLKSLSSDDRAAVTLRLATAHEAAHFQAEMIDGTRCGEVEEQDQEMCLTEAAPEL